jgi:hypothetical protein
VTRMTTAASDHGAGRAKPAAADDDLGTNGAPVPDEPDDPRGPRGTGSEPAPPRSPAEAAVGEGRDPRWEELLELCRRVGPSPELAHLDDRGLERELRVGASRLAAETCRWLGLLAELVVRGVWAEQGAKTPAVWLSWALGIAPATARDQVRVSLRLRELDRVRERFAAGRISYSKVRAITRVAIPELEEMLLVWADQSTAAELEEAVRGFRRAQRGRRTDVDEPERRRGAWVVDHPDGTSDLVLRLPTDEAHAAYAHAQHLAVREERVEQTETAEENGRDPHQSASAEAAAASLEAPGRHYGARVADAVLHALTAAVVAGPVDTSGEDRHTLVVHVSDHDLDGEEALPVAVETSTGRVPSMSRRVLRRLACEAGIVFVATDAGGTPVDVGRRARRLSAALRRALRSRDRGCRFPGCAARRHLQAHHVVHWADDGPTDLANLVLLCGFHHRYVHAHDYDIDVHPTGAHTFHRRTGQRLPHTRTLPALEDRPTPAHALSNGLEGTRAPAHTADALQPRYWDGYFDLDTTVAVLQQQFHAVLPDTALAA